MGALFESAAICEFLDETHSPRLIPTDPFERARQRGWVEVANDLLVAQYKELMASESADAEAAAGTVDAILGRFEEAPTTGLLRDDELTFLHIAVAPALRRFVVVEDELSLQPLQRTPSLARLARRLVS